MNLFGKKQSETSAPAPAAQTTAPAVTPISAIQPRDLPGKNRKILVVDDNAVIVKAFDMKLKASGFNVVTAMDGATAVGMAKRELPDAIVLDINFPPDVGSTGLQWDGFNIMQWLRRFKEVADIPIVIITGGDPAKFKDRSLAAGAAAFFTKPVDHKELVDTLLKNMKPAPAAESPKLAAN